MWLSLALSLALAGPTEDAASVAAMPAQSTLERLDQLIAASVLDEAALRALAPTHPVLVYQLRDPGTQAALALILALPPSEIRKIREGQMVIRTYQDWGDDEKEALDDLCKTLGIKRSRVDNVAVQSKQTIRIELVDEYKTWEQELAWPADWNLTEARAALSDWLGASTSDDLRLTDPSFENSSALGIAWTIDARRGATATIDVARQAVGRASLRLDAPEGRSIVVRQRVAVQPGQTLQLVALGANDGGDASLGLVFVDSTDTVLESPAPLVLPDLTGWQTLATSAEAPAGATHMFVELSLTGPGAANFDDLRLVGSNATVAVQQWRKVEHGRVRLWADPTRIVDPVAEATRINQILDAAMSRLGALAEGTVSIYLTADAAHAAALGPTVSDVNRGVCWMHLGDPAPCAVESVLRRAWGAPINGWFATGLINALAGASPDLTGLTASLPPLPAASHPRSTAAAVSFASFVLARQGPAVTRAFYQSASLSAVSGFSDLEAAWRSDL